MNDHPLLCGLPSGKHLWLSTPVEHAGNSPRVRSERRFHLKRNMYCQVSSWRSGKKSDVIPLGVSFGLKQNGLCGTQKVQGPFFLLPCQDSCHLTLPDREPPKALGFRTTAPWQQTSGMRRSLIGRKTLVFFRWCRFEQPKRIPSTKRHPDTSSQS